mmetsp:Transcript_12214/g.27651  ORF Transcript_12214/g.27651 Transcript_12214/m.27651 type:complete len:1183 (+) Transcript_12214:53-3601(+)
MAASVDWRKGDPAEVWSDSDKSWRRGTVTRIEGTMVYVDYTYGDGRAASKGIPDGHQYLRRPTGAGAAPPAPAAAPAPPAAPNVAARPYGSTRPSASGVSGAPPRPTGLPPAPAASSGYRGSADGNVPSSASASSGQPRIGDSVQIWSNTENKWLPGQVEKIDGVMIYINYKYSDGRTASKGVPAGHKDIRGYGAGALSNSAASAATALESETEKEAVNQLRAGGTKLDLSRPFNMPELSKGGPYDNLLSPGNSQQLLKQLPQLFRNDPPSDAGRQSQKVGTFHSYHGTYAAKVFSPDAVMRTLDLAEGFWGRLRNVQRLTVPSKGRLIIVGDTHGQLEDVLWMFFKYGPPTATNQYLFNGDIVDRGGHALEILLLLFSLKRDLPDSVHILRGNHEDSQMSATFGFQAELESKFSRNEEGSWLLRFIVTKVFPYMPLCGLVSDRKQARTIAVLHGGIPVNFPGQRGPVTINADIEGIVRTVPTSVVKGNTYAEHIFYGMMWADPQIGTAASKPGRGNPFNESHTMQFCQANQISQLVRSHQPPDELGFSGEGYCSVHGGRCLTVFSASNYCGSIGNKGAVLLCSDEAFGSKGVSPSDHWAPAWPDLSRILQMHYNKQITDYQKTVMEAEDRARMSVMGVGMPNPTGSFVSAPGSKQPAAQQKNPQNSAPQNSPPALQQVENMVAERICKKKMELLKAFEKADARKVMEVNRTNWTFIMSQQLPEVPAVWPALADSWGLKDPVRYVEFLHRFQIISEVSKSVGNVDPFSAFTRVRLKMSNMSAKDLLEQFGATDKTVTKGEFARFLSNSGAELSEAQSTTLYNGMTEYLGRAPTVEDALLGIALVSVHETNTTSTGEASELSKWLGSQFVAERRPLAGFFILHDTDKDGFLSAQEFMQAVMSWQAGKPQQLSMQQLQMLATHIDAQGQKDGRIGLMEFLRALGPRAYSMQLASLLLTEVLKPVYFYKPTILDHFSGNTNSWFRTSVSYDSFYEALEEMNARMASLGEVPMRHEQMQQVCDIASRGGNRVYYKEFLDSLKAVDTYQRQQLALAGANLMGAAFQPKPADDLPYRQPSNVLDPYRDGGGALINKAKQHMDALKYRKPSAPSNVDPSVPLPAPAPALPVPPWQDAYKHRRPSVPSNVDPQQQLPTPSPAAPWQDERFTEYQEQMRDGFRDLKKRFSR